MKNEIVGELALVTGAGTGIGKAIAVRLAQLGCDVVLVGRTVSKLEATAAEVRAAGREAFPMACDLTDADAIERLVADVEREHGRLDVLVNNAGILVTKRLEDTTTTSCVARHCACCASPMPPRSSTSARSWRTPATRCSPPTPPASTRFSA